MAEPVVCSKRIACEASVEAVWDVLSDTDRLNWATGLNDLKLTAKSDATEARYLVRTRLSGFNVSYEESPYEWTHPTRFSVRRAMLSGPLAMLEMIFELEARLPLGCFVTLTTRLTPRLGLLRPLVAYKGRQNIDLLAAEVLRIDAALARGLRVLPARSAPLINTRTLERGLAKLQEKAPADLGQHLARYLHTADDMQVSAMRPFELADLWKTHRGSTLRLLFAAAELELLEARWQIICPSCRVPTTSLPTLREVGSHAACHFCDIGFDVDLERNVEITFAVSPQVRSTISGQYCIGGPAKMPHVLVQKVLPAATTVALVVPAEPGDYRLFVRGGRECTLRVNNQGAKDVRLDCAEITRFKPVALAPSGVLNLHNGEARALHAKIEDSAWSSQAATAQDVTRLTVGGAPVAVQK